jgi:hypothetical protein
MALQTVFATPWVDSPHVRGTSDLIRSCVLTLLACVYTALHLNVPRKQGIWAMLRSKLRWTLLGLLAPEIVLFCAASQFVEVVTMKHRMQSILKTRLDTLEMDSPEFRELRCYVDEVGTLYSTTRR